MLKLILWSLFTILLFSWLEEITGHIKSIDMKLTNVKDGNVIDKRSVVIGDTADDSNKQPMVDFVHGVCEMLHWETDEKSIKMMAENVIKSGIKELMKKARYSVR